MTPEWLIEAIRLAERYPFARPRRSFVFRSEPSAMLECDWRHTRTPVLAIGANAAPERLAVKFPGAGQVIPVDRAVLHDHAVVYASHFARYGAIPATLHPAPGARTEVFVTWLEARQLAAMHRSEGVGQRYAYIELDRILLEVEGRGEVNAVGAYVSRFGALRVDGAPLGVAGIATAGAALPAMDQRRLLDATWRRLAPEIGYLTFMARIVACFGYRHRQTLALAGDAVLWSGGARPPGRRSRRPPSGT